MVIDFCTYLGHWPIYQLPICDAKGMVEAMNDCGIDLAFVSLAGGVFRLDPSLANAELARRLEGQRDRLLPVGVVDIHTPGWEDELCSDISLHGLAGIRLYPYSGEGPLDAEELTRLGAILAEQQLPLFVAAFIDEERFQHPSVRVPQVTVDQMVAICRSCPATTIVINNLRAAEAETLLLNPQVRVDNVFLDINAMDNPYDGLATLIESRGSSRLVYGSQLPFLYPESAMALVRQSGLTEVDQQAILELNWQRNKVLLETVGWQSQLRDKKGQHS